MAYTTATRDRSSDTARSVRDSWASNVDTPVVNVYTTQHWQGESKTGSVRVWTFGTTEPANP